MCLKIYQLPLAKLLSFLWSAWKAAWKKTGAQLELLTDIDILLMVGKGIRGVMCLIIRHYTKANNKRIKDYDKNKESSYLEYCDVNNLYKAGQCTKVSSK